jgi:hypothetical protein
VGSTKIGSGVFGETHFHHGTTFGVTQRAYAPCPISQNAAAPNTGAATGVSSATEITAGPLRIVLKSMIVARVTSPCQAGSAAVTPQSDAKCHHAEP